MIGLINFAREFFSLSNPTVPERPYIPELALDLIESTFNNFGIVVGQACHDINTILRLNDKTSIHAITHIVGHLMREIENFIRPIIFDSGLVLLKHEVSIGSADSKDATLTLVDLHRGIILSDSKSGKDNFHIKQIETAVAFLPLEDADKREVKKAWLACKDAEMPGVAHFPRNGSSLRAVDGDFRKKIDIFRNFLISANHVVIVSFQKHAERIDGILHSATIENFQNVIRTLPPAPTLLRKLFENGDLKWLNILSNQGWITSSVKSYVTGIWGPEILILRVAQRNKSSDLSFVKKLVIKALKDNSLEEFKTHILRMISQFPISWIVEFSDVVEKINES